MATALLELLCELIDDLDQQFPDVPVRDVLSGTGYGTSEQRREALRTAGVDEAALVGVAG